MRLKKCTMGLWMNMRCIQNGVMDEHVIRSTYVFVKGICKGGCKGGCKSLYCGRRWGGGRDYEDLCSSSM